MDNDRFKDRLKNVPEKLRDAQIERMKTTEKMDMVVLSTIERFHKISMSKLEDFFKNAKIGDKYSRTFLINSLDRLEKQKKIFSRTTEDPIHGKLTKIYDIKSGDLLDVTNIKIVRNPFINFLERPMSSYAIKEDKIIIGEANNERLEKQAVFHEPVILKELNSEFIIIELSKKFIDFYELKTGKYYFEKRYQNDQIILLKKRILKSYDDTKKLKKLIVLLEDNKKFAKKLISRLEKNDHTVIWFRRVNELIDYLKEHGPSVDIISLDMEIFDEYIADKVSYEIRFLAPESKIGILSDNLDDDEIQKYQDLNFDFILTKKPNPKLGFEFIGDELISWLKVT